MSREGEQAAFKSEVKQWLKSHGLGYKWLAEQCGVSEITVRNWMSQKAVPVLKQRLVRRIIDRAPAVPGEAGQGMVPGVEVDAALSLTVKVSPEVYRKLEEKAIQEGASIGSMLARAISGLVG